MPVLIESKAKAAKKAAYELRSALLQYIKLLEKNRYQDEADTLYEMSEGVERAAALFSRISRGNNLPDVVTLADLSEEAEMALMSGMAEDPDIAEELFSLGLLENFTDDTTGGFIDLYLNDSGLQLRDALGD